MDTLYSFSAVFTGSFQVPAAGQVTFTVTSDDGFVFGVGNGAVRVSGPQENVPASTAFQGYAVMGGRNQRTAPAVSTIVVNFPAAGTYPYELDYTKGFGDNQLTLTLQAGGAPIPAATLLTLTPSAVPSTTAGQVRTFAITATNADGTVAANLPLTVAVTGVNAQSRALTTDGTGQASFSYAGSPLLVGADQVQATASVNGAVIASNLVTLAWNNGANQAPLVSAGLPQTLSVPNLAVLNGAATDDGLPADTLAVTWSMVSGPAAVTFDHPNQAATAVSFTAAGTYVLQLSASDGALTSTAQVTVTVNPNPTWSTGWLATPLDKSTVTVPTDVMLVDGITLTSGTLKYYPATDQTAPVLLNAATTGTGKIGVFDPTGLANGAYWVELRATNTSGQTMTSLVLVNVAGEYKPGRVTATVTDLVVPAPGLAIRVDRTYDSLDRGRSTDFGYGWRLGLRLNMETAPTGHVTFTLNGRRRTFYFTPAGNPVFQYWFVPQYTGEPGFYGKLVTTGDNCTGVLRRDGNQWACAVDNAGQKYEPTGYVYTDPGGRAYTIAADGSLQSIKDLNGNTLTVTAAGISSTSGLAVPFERDGQGRITKITDPLGHEYVYAYSAAGELAEVTYPSVATPAQYEYDTNHLLTKETNRRGNVAGTSTYYADGKLKSVTDALSNTTQYAYDLTANKTTVTNPDGGTVVTVADAYGSPLSSTDPLGRVTTNTYDANHNLLTSTNPLGKTTTYTYDAKGFRTSKKDPLGNTTSMVYNAFGGPTSITDPLGQVTTGVYDTQSRPTQLSDSLGQLAAVVYDARGNITSLTNANGHTGLFTYDTQGNVLTQTDALSRTTTYTYDSFGNRLSAKDPRGNTTQYAYDALNRLISTTNAAGGVVTQEYDEDGNLTETVDALSHRTTYVYDAANRQTQATYPDSSTSQTTYDWRGNVLTQTDQAGRVTKYTYDLAGQVLNITAAFGTTDASTVSSTYDAAGRVLTRSDGRGNVTTSGYDDAGRLTSLQTPSGTTSFAYDASGRRTAVTDANNHTTQSAYDTRGRLIKTTYADGSTTQSTYDGAGRQLTWTDQAGKVTTRQYDAVGQLITVTDAMNQATQYGYDAAGNLITRTDANGHTTTDTFDVLNRFAGRTWPAGGTASSSSFDSAGNLLSSTDHNGKTTTYTYDLLSQMLQKTPDASLSEAAVSYTYTATGQRATMTDASGTTTYSYDNLDRLVSKATPQGTLTYAYDSNGNVTSLQSSNANGVSLGYTYDTQNRIATVVDRRQAAGVDTTTYTYDATGNQATVTYGNGVQQTFAYDAANRLTQAPLLKGAAQFRNYSYGRAATGHILSVTENSGRTATYGFDNAWRLTSEAVASDPAGGNGLESFGLDPANNRLSLASTLSGILAQSFSYNANDQIGSETYDNNGNTLTSGGKTYSWDFENRLKSFNGGAVTMVYDGDGARVAKTAAGGTTRYLVDDLNPTGYAQVVEEISGGVVQRRYAYGPRRISETQLLDGTWTSHWYGYDGEGHVRSLTDATGTVTDTYDYDAFGNVVGSTGTTPNAYRYRGEQWDADLGLYYLRARWYNPVTGRFLSRDPLDTGNKYAYAAADPVNGSDPSGQMVEYGVLSKNSDAAASTAPFQATVVETAEGTGTVTKAGADVMCILRAAGSLLESAIVFAVSVETGAMPVTVHAGACLYLTVAFPLPVNPIDPGQDPHRRPEGPSQPRRPDDDEDDRRCNGHVYEVGRYFDLAKVKSGVCQAHHVPQDALARQIYGGVVTIPGWPEHLPGPAIILPPEEHLILTIMQLNRQSAWRREIDARRLTQEELIDRLIREDFDMLSRYTGATPGSLSQLRSLVRSVYGR